MKIHQLHLPVFIIFSILSFSKVKAQISLGISSSTYLNNFPVVSSAHYPIWGVHYDMQAKPRFEMNLLGYYALSKNWSVGARLGYLRQGVWAKVFYSEVNSAYTPGTLVSKDLDFSAFVPRISIQYARTISGSARVFAEFGILKWISIGNQLGDLDIPIVEGFPGTNYTLENALEYQVSNSAIFEPFFEIGISTLPSKWGIFRTSAQLTATAGWSAMFEVQRYAPGMMHPELVNNMGGWSRNDRQLALAWIFPEIKGSNPMSE